MSTENLSDTEARKKLKELVKSIKVAMMVTALDKKPLSAIPMFSKKVQDDGSIWFLSLKNSEHNKHIKNDKEVQLLYSDPSDFEFLSVFGTAEIITDKKILKELYDPKIDNWFDGPDDPNLTAIKFSSKDAHYWNTKSNSYISLLKMGVAAVTGKQQDIGKKGDLKL